MRQARDKTGAARREGTAMGLMARWGVVEQWRGLDRPQRMTVWAAYLGWTLDAFDFFLMVFMLKAIAAEFHSDV